MKKILLVLLMTTAIAFAQEYRVVFNLTSGDDAVVGKHLIGNIKVLKEHYESQGDTLKTAVVISGSSYKYFLNTKETKLDKKFLNLHKLGTEFKVCSKGMKKHKISKDALEDYVVPAFNRTAALIEYQNDGYAYIAIK